MIKKILPMNAYTADSSMLKNKKYFFEPKLDGIRALCFANKTLKFVSRSGRNITSEYKEFNFRTSINAKSCILDGEIVVYNKQQNPSFSLWQQGYEAHFAVFDILMKDGKSLMGLPLIERKKILNQTVTDSDIIEKVFYTKNGPGLWKEIKKRNLEGVVAKEENSFYFPGIRSSVWLKIKLVKTIDCIIVGFTSGRRALSSLLLALYDEHKKLRYIGKVGTGFSQDLIKQLLEKFKKIEQKRPLLENIKDKNVTWIKPKLVCEINYTEFTPQGHLRHPSFKQLRPDKKPADATIKEQVKSVLI